MGIFGGGNSSTAVSNDNRDLRQTAGDSSILIGAGAQAQGMDPAIVKMYMDSATVQSNNGTDAVKTLAQFGASELKNMGQSVTDILGLAANNATQSWEHMIDKSSALMQTQAATSSDLAKQAVLATNPNQSANETVTKVAMFAAIALVAFFLLRKKAA